MADSFDITLNSLGRTYSIPTGGATDWRNGVSRYLRDSATVINSIGSGSLVTPVINVRNYGATGNGTTDDTAAIQAAMAALALTGTTGGTLYFPSGTYKYTSRLQFGVSSSQKNVKLSGDGVSSVLKPTGSFSTNPTIEFRNCDYWSIQSLKFDASARTGSGDTILIDGCSFGLATNNTISGASRYGINVTQVSGTSPPAYNVVTGNVYSSNTTDNVNVKAGTIGNVYFDQNTIFPGPFTVDVKTRFGIAADGTTDDTAAIQAALDFGYNEVNAARPCALLFPTGSMKVTSTLLWRGTSASAPALLGAFPTGAAFDHEPTKFVWAGANNGSILFAQSANKGVLQDLTFEGASIAGCALELSATTYADRAILAATSGIRVIRCAGKHMKVGVVGNAVVKLGTDPALAGGNTYQQSEVVFRDCDFVGEDPGAGGFSYAGMKAVGIKTMSGGNCKNFAVYDCIFATCDTAIDWTNASGNFDVTNFNCADVRNALKTGGGNMVVVGGDIEAGHVDDFRLLSGSGGGGDPTCNLLGLQVAAYMSGATGTLIEWGGYLELVANYLTNGNSSVSGNPTQPNPFRIKNNIASASQPGGIVSRGNWFVACGTPYAPFYDTSGNALTPVVDTFGGNNPFRVSSQYDKGGTTVSTPVALTDFDSAPTVFYQATINGPLQLGYLSSRSVVDSGINNKTWVSIDATGGNKTFTPPAAAASNLGRSYFVYKFDSSANTVTSNGVVLNKQNEFVWMVSNGSSWENLVAPATSTLPGYVTAGTQTLAGQKTFTAPLIHSATTGITAHAGGGQGSATALTTDLNFVTTVASGNDSVKLPTGVFGMEIAVYNSTANACDVFPVSGAAIDALGANNPYSLAGATGRLFWAQSATQWYSK